MRDMKVLGYACVAAVFFFFTNSSQKISRGQKTAKKPKYKTCHFDLNATEGLNAGVAEQENTFNAAIFWSSLQSNTIIKNLGNEAMGEQDTGC